MPEFGELLPADVWAAVARTLTAFDARTLFDLPLMPSYYPAAISTQSATADTFGSWVQISANVGSNRRLVGALVSMEGNQPRTIEVELGEGAAASEVAVARFSIPFRLTSDVAYPPVVVVPFWKSLSNNARLSVRSRSSFAAAFTVNVVPLVV